MKRLLHECRRRIAMALASIRLHQLTFRSTDGQTLVLKHRTWLSKLLIPPGNLFLRLMGADSFVLATAEWHRWEGVMSMATIESGNVVTPQHSGDTLDRILRTGSVNALEKQNAVRLALRALLFLQSRQTTWSDGKVRPLSHGDATAKNVCVDLKNQSAVWFDFDMRHCEQLPAIDRHADDVRALLFSSAACLPRDSFPALAESFGATVESPELFQAVDRQLHTVQRPSIFHLAQAPLTYAACHELRQQLMMAVHRSDLDR